MKSNDPYFQAFDMVIGYDSKTLSPKKKFPITKLESLVLSLIPMSATYAACLTGNPIAYVFSAFLWLSFIYIHVAVYMNECIYRKLVK